MILNSTTDLKKYISVAENFHFPDFEPYIGKAINSYIRKFAGDIYNDLADEPDDTPEGKIKGQAREHLGSAVANFGYFLFTPYNSVMMDGSGMSNVQNEQRKNIEWWQLNDIRRELLRSGHESMDLLLEVLDSNPEVFPEWTESFGASYNELIVNSASEFEKHYNIFESRQTFLALLPTMRLVEDQYVRTYICPELIEAIKVRGIQGNLAKAREYCCKAIVAFTIAKVYDEGIFNVDASGIKLKFDVLPNEKVQAPDYGRPAEQLKRAVSKQLDNGTQYMKMLKDLILSNPGDFTQCANPLMQKDTVKFNVYNTQGVVGL